MRQNIMNKLEKLFFGTTDTIKVTYYTRESQEIMKFEMLEHKIAEEDGIITMSLT